MRNLKTIMLNGTVCMLVAAAVFTACSVRPAKNTGESGNENQYVPAPERVATPGYLVGAFRCPLWNNETRPGSWDPIRKYPERKPVLGWYNEGNPEVTDWEIKYAVEHGISFFIECWFREKNNEGQPVKYTLGHWLDSLHLARYSDSIKFVVMWENLNKIASGISSEQDLMENLIPFWIENYFSRSNYLLIEGKPVFMIYGYNKFINELGGPEAAAIAIKKMRQACVDAGFKGLWLMAEHHLGIGEDIPEPAAVGFDVITSYHWPSFTGLMPVVPEDKDEIAALQEKCWSGLAKISNLPAVPTVSMGWDSEPWGSTYYKGQWFIEPAIFRDLCSRAKVFTDGGMVPGPFSGMVLLDNWNEYGEGHYIFPTEQFGFGYLDAVREVFSNAPAAHEDIVPSDIGLGPYEADAKINQ
jgi:hypothetical protein